ncbi:MAG: hypothetical protein R2813_01280 [Flavobacteriales bacterium]
MTQLFKKWCTDPKLSQYDSVDLVRADHWNHVVGDENVYLSLAYLGALEKALNGDIDFRYTIFYNDKLQPVAASYIQIMHYSGGDGDLKFNDTFCRVGDHIKSKLIGSIDARVLICGNVFASGENGFAFTDDIKPKEAYKMLAQSMKRMAQEKETNGQISFGLLKEFWPQTLNHSNSLEDENFKAFEIDVNMVLNVHPTWKTFEDYLDSMTTKFRTKAKGVLKKSSDLMVIDMNLNQVIAHQDRIEELYLAVLDNAEFKFGQLNAQAFVNLKQNLGDRFTLKGYFLSEKLVGFSTVFLCNDKADANYVGIDYECNKEYAVYQRMLYDFVEFAIDKKLVQMRLGRTAETLKSSVGAEPVNMKLYIRHRNSISNTLIGPLVSSISPSEFELRPPFKAAFA